MSGILGLCISVVIHLLQDQPINKQTWRTEKTKGWNFVIASYKKKHHWKTHALLNYTVSFYTRVMFLKNVTKTEHKILI